MSLPDNDIEHNNSDQEQDESTDNIESPPNNSDSTTIARILFSASSAKLRKNALLISQSYASNFALYIIKPKILYQSPEQHKKLRYAASLSDSAAKSVNWLVETSENRVLNNCFIIPRQLIF